jgi:DNA mismatch repair ATPase MutS
MESTIARIAAPILVALTLGAFIYMWFYGGPPSLFLVAALAHSGYGTWYRSRVKDIKTSIEMHAREFTILQSTLERLDREEVSSSRLRELRSEFGSASKKMKTLVGYISLLEQQRNEMVMLVAFFLLWATQISFAIEQWRKRNGSEMDRWLRAVGEMEALCALAGYAFEHPEDPFPEIVGGSTVLEAEDVRHPLLQRSQCVPNSIKFSGDLQLLVISGSNMSGKSTLLRTVGTNVALALAGAPVRAARMRLSPLAIGATLRVQDSLLGGTSRFYAEIQRLRDIMELTERPLPVLLLLDEILYGTNSHDRTIGAEAVIRGLVERGAIGFVTTHDLALAKVADALAPRAANAHFEDRLEGGKMVFDYLLRPGVVQRSNALALMRAVGLKV